MSWNPKQARSLVAILGAFVAAVVWATSLLFRAVGWLVRKVKKDSTQK